MAKTFKSVEAVLPGLLEEKKMLEILDIVEKDVLPDLLVECDPDLWKSLFIDYEKPHVERLWYQLGPVRINLHKIHPCGEGEALFHPHPWPSAMHVRSGAYETAVGVALDNEIPLFASKGVIRGEYKYEMTLPNAWHYVRPIGDFAHTTMVIGLPYESISASRVGHKSTKPLRSLTRKEKEDIFTTAFRDYCQSYIAAKS